MRVRRLPSRSPAFSIFGLLPDDGIPARRSVSLSLSLFCHASASTHTYTVSSLFTMRARTLCSELTPRTNALQRMADKPPSSGLCVVFARVVAKEGKADELEKLLQAAVKSANSDKEPYTLTYRCARHGGESLLNPLWSSLFLSEVEPA